MSRASTTISQKYVRIETRSCMNRCMTTACIVFDISTSHQRTQLTTVTGRHQHEFLARDTSTVYSIFVKTEASQYAPSKVARWRTPRGVSRYSPFVRVSASLHNKRRTGFSCSLPLSALSDPNRIRCQSIKGWQVDDAGGPALQHSRFRPC